MNYFTHAIRYLDRPYFTVGVCIPDMLSVVDRKARVRGKRIEALLPQLQGADREIAEGIRQHLEDDRWFHGTAAFYAVTGEIARSIRTNLPEEESWRCGFLGHIVMELLLDSSLIEENPSRLDLYYSQLQSLDTDQVQRVVSCLATKEVPQLGRMIELFIQERFLEDYLDDHKLLRRLNQVMKRIQLAPLPDVVVESLAFARVLVREQVEKLLPEIHFPEQEVLREVI